MNNYDETKRDVLTLVINLVGLKICLLAKIQPESSVFSTYKTGR